MERKKDNLRPYLLKTICSLYTRTPFRTYLLAREDRRKTSSKNMKAYMYAVDTKLMISRIYSIVLRLGVLISLPFFKCYCTQHSSCHMVHVWNIIYTFQLKQHDLKKTWKDGENRALHCTHKER